MHTQRLFSEVSAVRCIAVNPSKGSRTYLRACATVRRSAGLHRVTALSPLSTRFADSSAACCAAFYPARCLSSGISQGSASPPTPTDAASGFTVNDVKESLITPEWVSSRKTNGEKRMSVSIRSGAQRQRARRPPNVPPHAPPPPPPPPSSIHPSLSGAAPPPPSSHAGRRQNESCETSPATPTHLSSPQPPRADAVPSNAPASPTSNAAAATRGGSDPHHVRVRDVSQHPQSPTASSSARASTATSEKNSSQSPPPSSSSSSTHPLLYSVSRFTEPVKRIILIRNGRSEANEDVAAYVHTPDWRIPLVEEGKRESIAAGRALSELTGDDPVYFYYSPYIRSRQSLRYVLQGYDEARLSGRRHTREWWEEEEGDGSLAAPRGVVSVEDGLPLEAAGITTTSGEDAGMGGAEVADAVSTDPTTDTGTGNFLRKEGSLVLNSGTSDNIIGVREDVRLRDGDIGRYTSLEELMHHLLERERYGKFFYRFPYGESGADVCDRVTSFLDAFQRERVEFPMNTNVVIITHGLTMRMFIKRWFHLTVETFHRMKSPPPGSLCTLTRLHHRSCFRLDESCVESMHLPLSLNEFNGYKYRNKQLLGSMSSGAPYM